MSANRGIAQNLNFANYLNDQIREHQSWRALETFGELLEQQPLDKRGLKVFLASTSCFFREIHIQF